MHVVTTFSWVLAACFGYLIVLRALLSSESVQGSPRYSWYAAILMQLVVFPGLAAAAWVSSAHETWESWLDAGWGDEERPFEQLWLMFFVAYMIKDVILPMDLLFWLHHVVCIGLAMAFSSLVPANPPATFMVGATIMEFGSSSQALFYLFPTHRVAWHTHLLGMTISNIAGLFMTANFVLSNERTPVVARAAIAFVATGLCTVRQSFCHANCGVAGSKFIPLKSA